MNNLSSERLEYVIGRLEHVANNVKWNNVSAAQELQQAADGLRELLALREAGRPLFEGALTSASAGGAVISDGLVLAPKEPTEQMVIAGFESEPNEAFSEPEIWEEYKNLS